MKILSLGSKKNPKLVGNYKAQHCPLPLALQHLFPSGSGSGSAEITRNWHRLQSNEPTSFPFLFALHGASSRTAARWYRQDLQHLPATGPEAQTLPSNISEQTGLLCPECGQRASRLGVSSGIMENIILHPLLGISLVYTSTRISLLLPAGPTHLLPLAIVHRSVHTRSDPRFLFFIQNLRVSRPRYLTGGHTDPGIALYYPHLVSWHLN